MPNHRLDKNTNNNRMTPRSLTYEPKPSNLSRSLSQPNMWDSQPQENASWTNSLNRMNSWQDKEPHTTKSRREDQDTVGGKRSQVLSGSKGQTWEKACVNQANPFYCQISNKTRRSRTDKVRWRLYWFGLVVNVTRSNDSRSASTQRHGLLLG